MISKVKTWLILIRVRVQVSYQAQQLSITSTSRVSDKNMLHESQSYVV